MLNKFFNYIKSVWFRFNHGRVIKKSTLKKWTKIESTNLSNKFANFEFTDAFSFCIEFQTSMVNIGVLFSNICDNSQIGYKLIIHNGYIQFFMKSLSGNMTCKTLNKWNDNQKHTLILTYNGSGTPQGIQIYIDTKKIDILASGKIINTSIINDKDFVIGSWKNKYRFIGDLDNFKVHNIALSLADIILISEGK